MRPSDRLAARRPSQEDRGRTEGLSRPILSSHQTASLERHQQPPPAPFTSTALAAVQVPRHDRRPPQMSPAAQPAMAPGRAVMTDHLGVARFHETRARDLGLRRPGPETRKFRKHVCARPATETRFARNPGPRQPSRLRRQRIRPKVPWIPRDAGLRRAARRDLHPEFAGLRIGPVIAGGAFPAFMKTCYSRGRRSRRRVGGRWARPAGGELQGRRCRFAEDLLRPDRAHAGGGPARTASITRDRQ